MSVGVFTESASSPAIARPSRASVRCRENLRASYLDGAAFGGMVGFGETWIPAFALALNLGEYAAGLTGSIPLLAGGIMQTISPWAVGKLGSRKRWVIACATLQIVTLYALLMAAMTSWLGLFQINSLTLLGLAAVYWGAGLASGPAWNTWIGTLVPKSIRPRFFAMRNRTSQLFVFLGFLFGGILLQLFEDRNQTIAAFALLFAIAGSCRLVSVLMLMRQSEARPIHQGKLQWGTLVGNQQAGSESRTGVRLIVYLVLVQAAVQMAGPYFTPFMFSKLGFSYYEFVMLISVSFLSKVIILPFWGKLARRIGAWRLMWIGGVGIVPMSAGWFVSQQIGWLLIVQFCSGAMWAAYELAFFLIFLDAIPEQRRTDLLTIFNLFNAGASVGGALLGSAWLLAWDASYQSYLYLFVISSGFRCVTLLFLWRVPRISTGNFQIGFRTLAVRPNTGSFSLPVLSSVQDVSSKQSSDDQSTR